MDFYRKILTRLDFTLIGAVTLIIAMSLFILDSATVNKEGAYVLKQLVSIGMGVTGVLILLRIDYSFFARYYKHLYVFNLFFLISVLIIGTEVNGAKSWIQVPGLGSVQPAEYGKIILIITFAQFLVERKGKMDTFWGMMPAFIFVAIPVLIILMQPDLGSSLVFIAVMIAMMYVAGANPKIMTLIFGGGTLAAVTYIWGFWKFGWWLPLKEYQLNRFLVLFDPSIDPQGVGWNVWQSKIAIGNGGLFGMGLGGGTQAAGKFLPEQWTDFIFAVFAEELGFIGASVLILLFGVLIFRGIKISSIAKDLYGSYIAIGVVTMYLFHILENIGMCMGIMPITGIPLPFVSYGGSSMLTNLVGIGLLLNIYVHRQKIIF